VPTPQAGGRLPNCCVLTALRVIVALEMETGVAESDDASSASAQLAALCRNHLDLLLGILSCKRRSSLRAVGLRETRRFPTW
jgi:hypothetical protein